MDPVLFSLLLGVGVAVGGLVGLGMGKTRSELPVYLALGGMGALLGGAMAQLSIRPSFEALVLLTAGVAAAILLLMILWMGRGRLAG